MNRKFLTITIALALTAVMILPVFAVKPNGPSAENGLKKNGKSMMQHLYLYEKDPITWEAIKGAWGKLTFDSDNYVFNGHKLTPESEYVLINYVDPWPGTGSVILGTGIADEKGNVHITDDFDFTSLPDEAKIWLVLSSDFDVDVMIGWNPTEYLFEYNLL